MAKQVEHWRKSAIEDLEVAGDLLRARRIRHSLFFMHLAVEKALKGLVCRHTGDLAPRTHNLATLAEKTGIQLLEEQKDLLAEINTFNIEGRYPETLGPEPTAAEAEKYYDVTRDFFTWLMAR